MYGIVKISEKFSKDDILYMSKNENGEKPPTRLVEILTEMFVEEVWKKTMEIVNSESSSEASAEVKGGYSA